MYEVELKVEAEHGPIRERLSELGAEPRGRVRQVDTYYDAPHRSFAETDEALRVREERDDDGRWIGVTYKGPLVEAESKTREEHETAVEDGDEMRAVLEGVGFAPAETVEKERERFRYREYTVTLDAVDGLGEFVEVETEAEAVEEAREGAIAVLRELDLDPDEQVRTSYLGLLLEDRDQRDASNVQ
ncbi:class IV adenylate cyclase [Salinirubellus sp. GCM10025818]|uniref:class IV adenylate cyclase n=1 Tax=Salinirubellus TaxID=2162630 RepID=UPI0030D5ABA6